MIKINNNILEPTCQLHNAEGYVGDIKNTLSLMDVRLQIIRAKLTGYWIEWNDIIIHIDKYGNLDEWPKGFYDIEEKQISELFKLRSNKG